MINHAKLSRHHRMFKTLTGLSTEGFAKLPVSFKEVREADLDHRDAGHIHRWSRSGGRKGGFPRGRRQARVHAGLSATPPHPGGAGPALRDEPAAGQIINNI